MAKFNPFRYRENSTIRITADVSARPRHANELAVGCDKSAPTGVGVYTMSSQSLYRKWRSQSFGEMVGQEAIIDTLKNALISGTFAHAYLFTGPRGTGKTSTARLLAKTINCEHPKDGEPCNVCLQCREITAGNSFNVIEIDAASNRGIDSIRDLREKVMMPPSTGKYKVYVLDEAHMLTTEAFNALLKTLEEPPNYAVFVLATTDVHKMLPTVISRCQRFDFKRITTRQIVGHLMYIAGEEHIKIERSAAELIARAAAGGMRDALSLLDQAIAYAGEEISLAQVQAMLGVADPRTIQKLIAHVAELDSATGLHLIHELSEAGADLRQINIQVGEYWRALMLAKAGADIETILDSTEDETRDIQQMTKLFELEELTESARIFAQNDLMQKNQGTPQLGLELAFLHSVELHRRAQSGQLLNTSSTTMPSRQNPAPASAARPAVTPSVQRSSIAAVPLEPPPVVAQTSSSSNAVPSKNGKEAHTLLPEPDYASYFSDDEEGNATLAQPSNNVPMQKDISGSSDEGAASIGTSGLTLEQVEDVWDNVRKRIKQKNNQTAALLNHYTVVSVDGAVEPTFVAIRARNKVFYEHMQQGERVKHVEWGLGMEFQRKFRVQLLLPDQAVPAPPLIRSANTAPSIAPQQSAHRERPIRPAPPSSEPLPPEAKAQAIGDNGHAIPSPGEATPVQPIAKKNVVRENTTTVSAVSDVPTVSDGPVSRSFETVEQKASTDPVVQEVMRTFTAKIVNISPK